MHLRGPLLALLLSSVGVARPLGRHGLDPNHPIWKSSILPSSGALWDMPRWIYRAKEIEVSGRVRTNRREPRLGRRNEPPGEQQSLETLRHKASVYQWEFLGSHHEEKRKKMRSKQAPQTEIERYVDLKSAYNLYELYKKRRKRTGITENIRPAPIRADPADFTPEQIATLHEKYKDFQVRYGKRGGKQLIKSLKSGDGTPEELAEYDDLRKGYNEYSRWKAWDRSQTAGEFTPEELAIREANREGNLVYRKEYMGPENREKRAKLEAGEGSTQEIARYKMARDQYRAYEKVYRGHRRKAGKLEIEVDPHYREEIAELEALRVPRNKFNNEFGGPANEARRKNLEAGIGDPEEVRRYHDLHEKALAFQRLYKKTLRKKQADQRRAEQEASDTTNSEDAEEATEAETIIGTGRPRWLKNARNKADGSSNAIVLESNQLGASTTTHPSRFDIKQAAADARHALDRNAAAISRSFDLATRLTKQPSLLPSLRGPGQSLAWTSL